MELGNVGVQAKLIDTIDISRYSRVVGRSGHPAYADHIPKITGMGSIHSRDDGGQITDVRNLALVDISGTQYGQAAWPRLHVCFTFVRANHDFIKLILPLF